MFLTHLKMVNVRNHPHTDVELGRGLNCFAGHNAQGKSSILEAVEVAATGRSHRAGKDADLVRFGESWARVRAAARRRDREVEVDVAWRAETPETRSKEIRVNGVPVRRGDLFGHILIVAATPRDQDVVTGAPAHRRRLLDVLLSQISPAYFFLLTRYVRAVEQRNHLLRDLLRATAEERERVLEPWDDQVSTLGASITARRQAIVTRISEAAQEVYAYLAGAREILTVEYAPSLRGRDEPALIASAREAFIQHRRDECLRGMTLSGPHRDDLLMRIDGRDLRVFGSRGQHQTAMLGLRFAEHRVLKEETGEDPIVLLDDAVQSLDAPRQQQLMRCIKGTQALMTFTTPAAPWSLPADSVIFEVDAGVVQRTHAYST